MEWRIKRLSAAVPIALVLVLVLTSQALATTWAAKVRLTTTGDAFTDLHSLATLDSSHAVAIFQSGAYFWVRRTTDSGSTWKPRQKLSDGTKEVWASAISGQGTSVDAVWSESDHPSNTSVLQYRRSTNSGSTFAPFVALDTGTEFDTASPDVARGPNGVVAVAWDDPGTNLIRVRVSTNGGTSFAPVQTLGTSTSTADAPPTVAVGNGAIYVAYFSDDTHVKLRRSLDGGATWKPATAVASDGSVYHYSEALSMTASGSHAYVAYTAANATQTWTRYRRTTNKGSTWSAVMDLSTPGAYISELPQLYLANSVLRAAYEQCSDSTCNHSAVMYESSSNGTSWSTPETASHSGPKWAATSGIGVAGKLIVLYVADNGGTSPYGPNDDLYTRTGTP
jgi:hypothetical protein